MWVACFQATSCRLWQCFTCSPTQECAEGGKEGDNATKGHKDPISSKCGRCFLLMLLNVRVGGPLCKHYLEVPVARHPGCVIKMEFRLPQTYNSACNKSQ